MKRRSFLKGAVLSTTAAAAGVPLILTSRQTDAQAVIPPSPATIPWTLELPPSVTPLPAATLSPPPRADGKANVSGGEIGRADHQRYDEILTRTGTTPQHFEMRAKENTHWRFNDAYPEQPIWGFSGQTGDATTPGPTIIARYGKPMICRIYNDLPAGHVGFGTPEISTHLHNLHTPSESDGFPGDFYSATKKGPFLASPGQFQDHFYPNIYAGFDAFAATKPYGDPREALGTLWYHDHTMDFTAPNVYKGLAGFYLIYDDVDSGNENDSNPAALRLPGQINAQGQLLYDYPIILQDKRFDANGNLIFDQFAPEGILGDKVTVNGKIEPFLRVERRKYRFRFLNGGPSRFYELYLQNRSANTIYTFTYIANDGNLLPAPLRNQFKVRLGMAERADIVVDFARFPPGTELYFVNQLLQTDTRGPGNVKAPGTRLLKLIVGSGTPTDTSQVPNILRAMPDYPQNVKDLPVTRRWEFARSGGLWTVNNQLFDVNVVRAAIPRNSGEVWELVNPENGWQHPIHIHFEEGIITRKFVAGVEVPVPAHEKGRKDVYVLGKDVTLRIFMRFRDFEGKYPMHCHNLIHEDHAMMIRFDIMPPLPA